MLRPIWPEMRVATQDELISEMNEKLQIPGMAVAWTQPIRNRLDMLATGVRTHVGVKVYGSDYSAIEKVSVEIENALKDLPRPGASMPNGRAAVPIWISSWIGIRRRVTDFR